MLRESLSRLFGGAPLGAVVSAAAAAPASALEFGARDYTRHSSALDQFFASFHGQVGLSFLDLGASNQENTDFFNQLGHKVRYDNFVRTMDESFGDGDFYANQENDARVEAFQSKVLNFDDDSVDGVLVWDGLQYLAPSLLEPAVSQIHAIMHKGAQLLTTFHTDERMNEVPTYSYRIQARNKVKLVERDRRRPAHFFTTRQLEKLFKEFDQVKFFLTQDALREVIVRK